MRGIYEWGVTMKAEGRIIPAGAEHFCVALSPCWSPRDHPRRCGAFTATRETDSGVEGSSPQVRGTYLIRSPGFCAFGIIPAGAGHFFRCIGAVYCDGDHPRRCGALKDGVLTSCSIGGSSPQVRGTLVSLRFDAFLLRIIPAGAGHLASI